MDAWLHAARLDTAPLRAERGGMTMDGAAVIIGYGPGVGHAVAAAFAAALATVRETLGEALVLVDNAAHSRPGPVLGADPVDFDRDLRLDVTGALVAARWAAPAMVARGRGTMLFTGGGLALYPSPDAPSLSVGKAGKCALALMLAIELAPAGVRVGTVTIAGSVGANSDFSPDAIAQSYLRLHDTPADAATAEIVFRGAAGSA